MRNNRETPMGTSLRKFKDKKQYRPTAKHKNDPIEFHIIQLKRIARELRRELDDNKLQAIKVYKNHLRKCSSPHHYCCRSGWNPLWQLDRHIKELIKAKKKLDLKP